ncbi:MAG: carbohydrate ABC transporter permease [Agathobacter rectalis]
MVEGRLDRNGSTFGFSLLEMDRCKYALFPFGLKSIDTSLYEAAEIDGANGWQKFRYVTLPLLRPTTIYVLTISIYAGLAMFLESYMLWAGNNSPKNIGLTIVGYLYKRGIEKMTWAMHVRLVWCFWL